MKFDIEKELRTAYEEEWNVSASPTSTDSQIISTLADVASIWDDPSLCLWAWKRVLEEVAKKIAPEDSK